MSYQADAFDDADAERVAQLFEQLDRQGDTVMTGLARGAAVIATRRALR